MRPYVSWFERSQFVLLPLYTCRAGVVDSLCCKNLQNLEPVPISPLDLSPNHNSELLCFLFQKHSVFP